MCLAFGQLEFLCIFSQHFWVQKCRLIFAPTDATVNSILRIRETTWATVCVAQSYALLKIPVIWDVGRGGWQVENAWAWRSIIIFFIITQIISIVIVLTKEHTQVTYEMQFHFDALCVNILYVNLCVRLRQTLTSWNQRCSNYFFLYFLLSDIQLKMLNCF